MTELSRIDGNTLEGVSATTLWTLHHRGTEAKRADGVIHDPWAVTVFDAISCETMGSPAPRRIVTSRPAVSSRNPLPLFADA